MSFISGYLEKLSHAIVDGFHLKEDEELDRDYLKVITNPFTKLIIQVKQYFLFILLVFIIRKSDKDCKARQYWLVLYNRSNFYAF